MQKTEFHRWGQSNRGLNPQNLLQGLLHTLENAEKRYTQRQTVITLNILILRNENIYLYFTKFFQVGFVTANIHINSFFYCGILNVPKRF